MLKVGQVTPPPTAQALVDFVSGRTLRETTVQGFDNMSGAEKVIYITIIILTTTAKIIVK